MMVVQQTSAGGQSTQESGYSAHVMVNSAKPGEVSRRKAQAAFIVRDSPSQQKNQAARLEAGSDKLINSQRMSQQMAGQQHVAMSTFA